MPRPTDFRRWASDATFTSGPATGNPVRVNPANGVLAQGFVPDAGFLGEYANYCLHNLGLHTEHLFNYAYDGTEEHSYETPKPRVSIYRTTGDSGSPFAATPAADWIAGDETLTSNDNDLYWLIPLRGIPAQMRVDRIRVRARTNNHLLTRVIKAAFWVVRYMPDTLTNLLIAPSSANSWEPVLQGYAPPGPWYHEFAGSAGVDVIGSVGGAGNPVFFIEPNYIYGIVLRSGTDPVHAQDTFYGAHVDWTDYGPRNA